MKKTIICLNFLILIGIFLTGTFASGDIIHSPKRFPSPSTQKQDALIKQGTTLHDRGDYAGAIRTYEEILRENPDNVYALYELAYSYSAKKDFKKSLEMAFKGVQYHSDYLSLYYALIGNNFDQLGESEKAEQVFELGVKRFPKDTGIYFNLAITQFNQNKIDDARHNFEKAVSLNPTHVSSHYGLCQALKKGGYRIPALLAISRFLVLEPQGDRARIGLDLVSKLIHSGVERNANANQIFLDPSVKTDEGDFSALNLVLSGSVITCEEEKGGKKSPIQQMICQFDNLFSLFLEMKTKNQVAFTCAYYVPYFVEMKQKNYVDVFCYYISQNQNTPEIKKWLQENKTRVNEFLNWSQNYQWGKYKN